MHSLLASAWRYITHTFDVDVVASWWGFRTCISWMPDIWNYNLRNGVLCSCQVVMCRPGELHIHVRLYCTYARTCWILVCVCAGVLCYPIQGLVATELWTRTRIVRTTQRHWHIPQISSMISNDTIQLIGFLKVKFDGPRTRSCERDPLA